MQLKKAKMEKQKDLEKVAKQPIVYGNIKEVHAANTDG